LTIQFAETYRDNLTLKAGYDRTFRGIAYAWDTATEAYAVADITAANVDMTVTDSVGATKWSKSGTLIDASNGIFHVEFADTDSTSSDIDIYDYIIEITTSTGLKYLMVSGKFEVT
jgi:hypothetical protein